MILNDFLAPLLNGQRINDQNLKNYDDSFFGFDIGVQENCWAALDFYFSQLDASTDRAVRWSYFRWYTDLTWKYLKNYGSKIIAPMAVSRQLPMAALLGYSTARELCRYFKQKTGDVDDMKNLYKEIIDHIKGSQAYVGVDRSGKSVSLSTLFVDATKLNRRDLSKKIEEVIAGGVDKQYEQYIRIGFKEAAESIAETLSFFTSKPEDLVVLIEQMINPQEKTNIERAKNIAKQYEVIGENNTASSSAYINLKKEIEKKFGRSHDKYDLILEELRRYAEIKQDPKITELYYFDQTDNQFHWNEELINDVRNTKTTKVRNDS